MRYPRTIYAIRHNATQRIYIGSSFNYEQRVRNHLYALRGHRHSVEDMQKDFDNYGDDYTITVLEENIDYDNRHKEYEWMEKYQSYVRGKGYNYKDHPNRSCDRPRKLVRFSGKTVSLSELSRMCNISCETLYSRIFVRNWTVERAISEPIRKRGSYYDRTRKATN